MPHVKNQTFSSVNTSVHDADFNASDYPALKHFFSAGNLSIGDVLLQDQIGSVAVACGVTAYINTSPYAVKLSVGIDTALSSGAWAAQGTGVGFYWTILDVNSGAKGWNFGKDGGPDTIQMLQSPDIYDGTNNVTLNATGTRVDDQPQCTAVLLDIPNDLGTPFSYSYATDTVSAPAGTALAASSVTDIASISAFAKNNGNGFFCAGMMVFADPNEVPSLAQLKEAVMWMTDKAINEGVYAPYPGWKNIS